MKILHTSDWHLGHALYNYDRSEEQICFLNQLTGIVQEEQPDVMVVSGDIYHYSILSLLQTIDILLPHGSKKQSGKQYDSS